MCHHASSSHSERHIILSLRVKRRNSRKTGFPLQAPLQVLQGIGGSAPWHMRASFSHDSGSSGTSSPRTCAEDARGTDSHYLAGCRRIGCEAHGPICKGVSQTLAGFATEQHWVGFDKGDLFQGLQQVMVACSASRPRVVAWWKVAREVLPFIPSFYRLRRKNRTSRARPRVPVPMSPASGPKGPPVMRGFPPERVRSRPLVASPLTGKERMGPCTKFQEK